MATVSNVGPGWYAVDEFLVKKDNEKGYVCNCLDYKDFDICKHVKQIVQLAYSNFIEGYDEGKYNINGEPDVERYARAKEKFDEFMAKKVPDPAFLQEIPRFQETIFKVLSIPRGRAKSLWEVGIVNPDQIIQHLF